MTVIAGVALFTGCSTDLTRSPLAPEQPDTVSNQVIVRSTKPAWKTSQTPSASVLSELHSAGESNRYSPNTGVSLGAAIKKYGTNNDVRVKSAYFVAPENSLVGDDREVSIEFTVYSGTTLSDVDVVFGPEGLAFEPTALLVLKLTGPVTPEEVMAIGHFGGDGTYIEMIETEVKKNGEKFLSVHVRVPGFSRYSLGGGR